MSADIVDFPGETILPTPIAGVLDGAKEADLTSVLVVGMHPDRTLYLAANNSEMGDLLIMLERAKAKILEMAE